MSKFEKLIQKILNGKNISYNEAENLLLKIGYQLEIRGSHHTFRKTNFPRNVSLKIRPQLLSYQVDMLKEVLLEHGYKKDK